MRHRGVTLLELIIVLSIIGVTAAMAFPKLNSLATHEAARGARREVTMQIARARAAAAQRGCRATMHISAADAKVWVTACKITGTGLDTIGSFSELDSKYGVTMTSTADSLPFGSNTLGLGTATINMTFVRSDYTASLRINAIGRPTW